MTDLRKIGVCALLFSIPFLLNWHTTRAKSSSEFHTSTELRTWAAMVDTIPDGYNGLFLNSSACIECHGYDDEMIASVDLLGNDINVVDDWRATMMANSAKDPFWRAKVSHEVLLYSEHQQKIESKCTSCHAPLGHFAAFHNGANFYSMAQLENDSLGLDGVSCLACHQQSETNLGQGHSGDLLFDTARVAYGPFESPLSSPMLLSTDYEPVYSPHISDSGLCAGCHTLITETFDYEGNETGNTFVEQATYHEWLNSRFALESISCQNCHLPELEKGSFFLVNGFDTQQRDSFYLHDLVGANTTMLKLMKNNIEELGITATPEQFDEVIAKTEQMLRFNAIDMNLTFIDRDPDTAFFKVDLLNKAGHKFPSGYPARRVFIEFTVEDTEGNLIFASGNYDENFELLAQNEDYEPHYQTINSEDQAQIYELVIGDVNDEVTTVLLRGNTALKDNRLAPQGFLTEHYVYDTVAIYGNATFDPDFNIENGMQGSGTDVVYYNVPMNGNSSDLIVSSKIYYQSTPPKWMEEMFSQTTPEIESFKVQFEEADRTPFLIRQDTVHVAGYSSVQNISQSKTPISSLGNGLLEIDLKQNAEITVFNLAGKLILRKKMSAGTQELNIGLEQTILIVYLKTNNNEEIQKVWMR